MPTPTRTVHALAVSALLALGLGACGSATSSGGGAGSGRLDVTVSFYPLEYATERIGGSHVQVSDLTKPGAEPHDLELTPRDVAALSQADLVVTVGGFQPAVDAGVRTAAPRQVLDVQGPARLDRTYTPIEDGEAATDEQGARDPHFWLDPVRFSAVSAAVASRLEQLDPEHAADYRANLAALQRDLTTLDTDLRTGLADCADRDVVTSHNAFGYLAERYDLHQVGITGLSPEGEVSARQLADVADFVREHRVRTIYSETLVSPALADTVARETGARTAVLDPIEGISDRSPGRDYLQVMRANLRSLQTGQPCS